MSCVCVQHANVPTKSAVFHDMNLNWSIIFDYDISYYFRWGFGVFWIEFETHEQSQKNKSETYCIEVLKHHPLYYWGSEMVHSWGMMCWGSEYGTSSLTIVDPFSLTLVDLLYFLTSYIDVRVWFWSLDFDLFWSLDFWILDLGIWVRWLVAEVVVVVVGPQLCGWVLLALGVLRALTPPRGVEGEPRGWSSSKFSKCSFQRCGSCVFSWQAHPTPQVYT